MDLFFFVVLYYFVFGRVTFRLGVFVVVFLKSNPNIGKDVSMFPS